MPLSDDLLKKISKSFEPLATVPMRHRDQDLVVVTDKNGKAIKLFIGKINAQGIIKGDRYTRTLKYNAQGKLLKDHWERKGKAS